MPDKQETKNNHLRRYPYYSKNRYYNHIYELRTEQPRLDTMICLLRSFLGELQMFLYSLWRGSDRLPKNKELWRATPALLPELTTNASHSDQLEPVSKFQAQLATNSLNITWVGHSTFLIQTMGKNILTDPIFGNATFLFPRILAPGISLAQLPPIDYILISHNHLDHMHYRSIMAIKKSSPNLKLLVPRGDSRYLLKWGFQPAQMIEGFWWESYQLGNFKFTFLPAYHWSQRSLFDKNKSLWGSWMIETSQHRLYFAGDTAYSGHFNTIAQEFPLIDMAFMPIAPCEPRKYLHTSHINAAEAGQAFQDLGAKIMVPMHWGTFHFGSDLFDTPIRQIKKWWNSHISQELGLETLKIMKIGESYDFSQDLAQQSLLAPTQILPQTPQSHKQLQI